MYICILKNEFITLLGYKSLRLATNRIISQKDDLKIFSRTPNIKIGDSTGQIILEIDQNTFDNENRDIYLNDDQVKTIRLDQILCFHLVKDDEDLQNLCDKHHLSTRNNEFNQLWRNWLLLETSRTCHHYAYSVASNVISGQFCNSGHLEKVIRSFFSPHRSETKQFDSFLSLLEKTRSVIESARDCVNQNQYALIELPFLFIEETLEIEIKFDEIESTERGIYPKLISNRLKNQKFYGQLVVDSEMKKLFKYLSETYTTIFSENLSPLGVTTYLISCDQIFTKTFNPYAFEKNIKRLSLDSTPEEAFLIAFMVASQYFIREVI